MTIVFLRDRHVENCRRHTH